VKHICCLPIPLPANVIFTFLELKWMWIHAYGKLYGNFYAKSYRV
jgi:hypothetical protein